MFKYFFLVSSSVSERKKNGITPNMTSNTALAKMRYSLYNLSRTVTFDSSSSTRIASCYDSTNNRIVVSYVDTGSDDDGTVAVGTVNASDNSISWGTPVAFNSNVKITITDDCKTT